MEIRFLRLHPDCFGTGREHKLNLVRRLATGRGNEWMIGSARAGTHSREALLRARDLGRSCCARSPERAWESCVFRLTRTGSKIAFLMSDWLEVRLGNQGF